MTSGKIELQKQDYLVHQILLDLEIGPLDSMVGAWKGK